MLEEVGGLRLLDPREGRRDARVGDHDVDTGNVVRGAQGGDRGGGVGVGGAVDLDDNEGAIGAFWEVGERLAGGVRGVSDGGYDGVVWAEEIC